MTPVDDPGTGPDDRLIDLLVDGELDPARRRALLLRLDAEPDGWRRCALAFLEAQAWRQSLGALAGEARPAPREDSGARRPRTRSLRLVPMAAAALAAFALGWAAGGADRTRGGRDGLVKAPGKAEPPAAPPVPAPPVVRVAAAPAPPAPRPFPATVARWSRPILTDYERSRLERLGYRVERQHGLLAVGLKDGRGVAIPVDEVMVRFVGRRTY
jgi:hypothetical protein